MVVANDATVKAGAFLSGDDQEGDSRAADRVRMRAPARLPRRFGWRVPADAR